MSQETTAVSAEFHRRGVALAFKLRGLAYKEHGHTHVHTRMASDNTAMVALNTRLGFRLKTAYITFSKDVALFT